MVKAGFKFKSPVSKPGVIPTPFQCLSQELKMSYRSYHVENTIIILQEGRRIWEKADLKLNSNLQSWEDFSYINKSREIK